MSRLIFIADADYEGRTESELTFRAGESIRILKNDGDWWFGESKVTGCQGWVAPSYGHTMAESSPYSKLSDNEKVKKRKPLWNNILSSHEQFLKAMKSLNEIIISPLMLRDDSFKRSFVDDPDIALGFSLLSELYITCRNFSVVLSKAVADAEIAHAYLQFSPSLQVFAQYIAGNSKLVNAVQSKQKLLKDFLKTNILPDKLTLEACLFLPLEHYPKYKEEFQEFVWLTPVSSSATGVLNDALDSLIAMTDYVDVKLQEEAQSLLVLKIQNQFLGRAPIYTPTRRILREGEIERVRINSKNEVTLKTHYAHLFNDALIYSVRNVIGYYRLHYAFDLRDAVLRKSDGAGLSNTFTIATPEKTEIFRFPTEEETSIWFSLLEDQIRQLKTVNKIAKRTSMITKANFLPGVKVSALGGRGQLIYRFLQSEIQFAEAMSMMNIAVIQPLLDASNGAKLTAVKVSTKSYTNEMGDSSINIREAAVNGDALFGKSTTTISNYQAAAITDALRAADVQIFLRASEGIASSLRDFVESLETACNKVEWKDDSLALGKAFSSVSALGLYNQFKSYASGQQAALRVLKTSNFEQFYKECEVNLAATPGSLQDKIEIPRNRIAHYLTYVSNLLQSTTEGHTDFQPLVDAQKKLTTTKDDVDEVIRLKKNFEILLEIQNSLVSLSVGSADPILSKIASMDRTFIKDGDLKKVCRKANKTFRFWLFNDYLLYGAAMGGGKYSFHRALDLKKCNVGIHTGSHKNALEIYGAEKSFVVIAKTDTVRNEWFEAIKIAREALGVASSAAAPLWKPDHNADACHVCGQAFTMWKRRHHCRKCGEVVCGDHSSHKELLPHINERVKQRICDKCFKGESDDRHSQTITTANVLNLSTNPFVDNNPSTTSKAVETTVAPASLKIEPAVSPKPVPKPVTPIKRATSPVPVKAASPASKPVASSVKPSTTATAAEVVLKDKAATSPMRARVEKPMQNNSDSSLSEKEQSPDYLANKKPGKLNSQLLNPFAGVTDERAVSPTNLAKSSSTSPLRAKSPELPTKPNKLKVETINNFSNNSKSTATPPGKPSKLSPSALNAFSQTTQSQKIVEPAKAREKSPVRLPKSPPPLPIAPPPLPTTPPPAIPSFVSRVDDAQEASPPFPGSTEQRASNKGRRGTTFRGTQRAAPPPPPLEDEATQVVGAVSLSSENPFGPKIVAEKDKSDIKDASRELPVVGVVIPAPPPMAPPVLPPAQDLLKGPEIQAQQPTIARPVAPPPLKPAPPTIKPPPPKKDGDAPPVKVPPPPPMPKIEDHPADSSSSEIDEDPVLKKYKKMKEMLPEGAVRQKMMSDGFSSLDIDSFMAGKPISLSPTSPAGGGSVADMLASAPALKSVVPSAPAAPVNKRMSIMDEIQQGARLKAVKLDDARMKAPAIQGKGGLLGMISQQMTQRRLNMKVEEDSDSDSSGGFDESSSEED